MTTRMLWLSAGVILASCSTNTLGIDVDARGEQGGGAGGYLSGGGGSRRDTTSNVGPSGVDASAAEGAGGRGGRSGTNIVMPGAMGGGAGGGFPPDRPVGSGGTGPSAAGSGGTGGNVPVPSLPPQPSLDAAVTGPRLPVDAAVAPVVAPSDAAVAGSNQVLPPAPAALEEACARWAKADCSVRQRCTPYSFEVGYGSVETCLLLQQRNCRLSLLTPGVGETADHRRTCAEGLEQQSCPDRVAGYVAPGCQVVPGKVANDRPCRTGSQCQGGACVFPQTTPPSPCGLCQGRSGAGGPCNPGVCEPGLVCLFQTTLAQGICLTTKKLGETCTSRDICDNGTCAAGICTPRTSGMIGQDCSMNSGVCSFSTGLYCNRLINKCEMNPPLGKDGDACGFLVDGSSGNVDCSTGTACVGVSGFVRTCLKNLTLGTACETQKGARCAPPGGCINGVCAIPEVLSCQ